MKVISIDGGGYLGIATASFIDQTEQYFGKKFADSFDLFCGTSTGAIISLALAHGLTGKQIVGLYESFGRDVFWNPILGSRKIRTLRSIVAPKYSNKYLKRHLQEVFGDATLGDLLNNGKYAVITAFSVSKGTPRIFKTDHSSDLNQDNGAKLWEVALASASAPTYFPMAKITSTNNSDELFCDGGVFANHPALLGYCEAVAHLKTDQNSIKLLSLSTPRTELAERDVSSKSLWLGASRGLVLWGKKLPSIFIDANSFIAHQSLRRLVGWKSTPERYTRIEFNKLAGLEMDDASSKATSMLMTVGIESAIDGATRDRVKQFFDIG